MKRKIYILIASSYILLFGLFMTFEYRSRNILDTTKLITKIENVERDFLNLKITLLKAEKSEFLAGEDIKDLLNKIQKEVKVLEATIDSDKYPILYRELIELDKDLVAFRNSTERYLELSNNLKKIKNQLRTRLYYGLPSSEKNLNKNLLTKGAEIYINFEQAYNSEDTSSIPSLKFSLNKFKNLKLNNEKEREFSQDFVQSMNLALNYLPEYIRLSKEIFEGPKFVETFKYMRNYLYYGMIEKNRVLSMIELTVAGLYMSTMFFLTISLLKLLQINTELTKIKDELSSVLEKDELTKLGNRIAFMKDKMSIKEPTLLLLNINNFKQINDSYGTTIGDLVLKSLADSLKEFIKEEGIKGRAYRLGADDFGILMEDNQDNLSKIAEDLIKFIENRPYKYSNDIEVPISVSVGISYESPLLEKADLALKQVKKTRNKYLIYTPDMNLRDLIMGNIDVIKTIKKALREDRVFLVYQPIEDLKTGKIEKYEVLVRLLDENGRVLYPAEFLELAKEAKYYGEITKTVLEKTFKILKEKEISLSVNLSVEDIVDVEIRDIIRKHIKKHSIAKRITFEILEDQTIEEYKEEFKDFVEEVKEFGAKIAIDDFGSGYSNFSHILKLKPDCLKIDGSLIKEIDIKEENKLIVETIVSFAHKLGIKTVAEFVWNKEVYDTVKKIGFDFAQGFYISKPMGKLPDNLETSRKENLITNIETKKDVESLDKDDKDKKEDNYDEIGNKDK